MTMPTILIIDEVDHRGMCRVHSPYEAKDLIKQLPARTRFWDASTKCWWVDAGYAIDLELLCQEHGITVHNHHDPDAGQHTPGAQDWVQACFQACPAESRGRLKRALMLVFHPDVGGSTEIAQRINSQ